MSNTKKIRGGRVVLYGVGEVGQGYYRHMKEERCFDSVLWVDRDYLRNRQLGFPVNPIEEIKKHNMTI